jgi:hypothetical protein
MKGRSCAKKRSLRRPQALYSSSANSSPLSHRIPISQHPTSTPMTLFRPSLLPSPLLNQLRSKPTTFVALASLPSPSNLFPTQRRAGSSRSKSSAFTTPGPILLSQPPGFVPQLERLAAQREVQKAYKENLRERNQSILSLAVDLCERRLEGGVEGIVRELKKKARFRS